MKLPRKEIEKIKKMMSMYSSLHESLSKYEDALDIISIDKKSIDHLEFQDLKNKIYLTVKQLEELRKTENKFYHHLRIKYGEGNLDIKTFEYNLKK